LSFSNPVA